MPSSIWTRCAGRSSLRPLSGRAWRVVESQHLFSTRKLVDSDAEQALLEELIEEVKPPTGVPAGLHYLLFTPFRYPPLRHGSRFGTRAENLQRAIACYEEALEVPGLRGAPFDHALILDRRYGR